MNRRTRTTLSLLLALCLCLGLGTAALAAALDPDPKPGLGDFSDVGEIDEAYYHAMDTLVSLGVVDGTSDGVLSPSGTYTREQAAKLAVYVALGTEEAKKVAAIVPSAKPFHDVDTDRWSAPYIAWCKQNGILDGYEDGYFYPTRELTGYQMAKMMLCVQGYGADGEYTGAGWAINTATDAVPLGVFEGDVAAATNDSVDRQQAILMVYNTLWISGVTLDAEAGVYVSTGSAPGPDVFGIRVETDAEGGRTVALADRSVALPERSEENGAPAIRSLAITADAMTLTYEGGRQVVYRQAGGAESFRLRVLNTAHGGGMTTYSFMSSFPRTTYTVGENGCERIFVENGRDFFVYINRPVYTLPVEPVDPPSPAPAT